MFDLTCDACVDVAWYDLVDCLCCCVILDVFVVDGFVALRF